MVVPQNFLTEGARSSDPCAKLQLVPSLQKDLRQCLHMIVFLRCGGRFVSSNISSSSSNISICDIDDGLSPTADGGGMLIAGQLWRSARGPASWWIIWGGRGAGWSLGEKGTSVEKAVLRSDSERLGGEGESERECAA